MRAPDTPHRRVGPAEGTLSSAVTAPIYPAPTDCGVLVRSGMVMIVEGSRVGSALVREVQEVGYRFEMSGNNQKERYCKFSPKYVGKIYGSLVLKASNGAPEIFFYTPKFHSVRHIRSMYVGDPHRWHEAG